MPAAATRSRLRWRSEPSRPVDASRVRACAASWACRACSAACIWVISLLIEDRSCCREPSWPSIEAFSAERSATSLACCTCAVWSRARSCFTFARKTFTCRRTSARLIRDAAHRVEPRDQVVHRRRAEQHLEPCVLVSGRVHRDEVGVQLPLRVLEVRLRELELGLVRAQVALDPGEPLVCEVVRVDGPLEVRVETLDLGHHVARLGLLRGDRARGSPSWRGSHESCREGDEEHSRLPHAKAGRCSVSRPRRAHRKGAGTSRARHLNNPFG